MHCSRVTSFQVYSIFVLASVSTFTSSHVYTSSLRTKCKNTLFEQPHIFQTQLIPDIDGNTIHVNCMLGFWIKGVLKDIWTECSSSTRETKRQIPLDVQWVFG